MANLPILHFKGAQRPPLTIVGSHLGSGSISFTDVKKRSFGDDESPPNFSQPAKAKFDRIVEELKVIVQRVLGGQPLQRSYSSIYKDVELVLMFKHSEQGRLADWILKSIDDHFDASEVNTFRGIFEREIDDPYVLARAFLETERKWSEKVNLIRRLFLVLDRAYLFQHPKKKDILTHNCELFMSRLFRDEFNGNISAFGETLIKLCEQTCYYPDRTKDVEFEKTARDLCFFLKIMNGNVNFSFDSLFQKLTIVNYTKLQHVWLEDEKSYLLNVMGALDTEHSFLTSIGFEPDFVMTTIRKLQWLLIFSDLTDVLYPSIPTLIEPENHQHWKSLLEVSTISQSYYGVDSMKAILHGWRKYVADEADMVITECKSSASPVIPQLVLLWNKLNDICFIYDEPDQLTFEVRGSMSKVILQKQHNRFVLLQLSKFCETILKLSADNEEQFDKSLLDALVVFKLVSNKNEFLLIYERDVSRRFLLGRNFNLQAEKKLFTAIFNLLGDGSETTNLTNMFRDIETSVSRYSDIHLNASPSIQFNALVLEGNYWPEMPKQGANAIIPAILSEMLGEFTAKYVCESDKYKFHVLDWSNYTFHLLTIRVRFKSGTKELTLTLVQAIVLMLFEDQNVLDLEDIANKAQLEERLLNRVVSSLSSDRYPILHVNGSMISFNESFSDKSSKIRIPLGREKEVLTRDEATRKIARSRTSEIRAALVRVMKAESVLTYPELLGKTTEILKVPASVQDLKVQIDHLITAEFFKRGKEDNTLHYIP